MVEYYMVNMAKKVRFNLLNVFLIWSLFTASYKGKAIVYTNIANLRFVKLCFPDSLYEKGMLSISNYFNIRFEIFSYENEMKNFVLRKRVITYRCCPVDISKSSTVQFK